MPPLESRRSGCGPPTWPGLAGVGLRTRRMRAALSALGIAIGVAAIVAVLGLSASSQAGLLAEIDKLGTNLLTVATGRPAGGDRRAPDRRSRHDRPDRPGHRGAGHRHVDNVNVYRSPLIPTIEHQRPLGAGRQPDLPAAVGTTVAQGRFLNAATARHRSPCSAPPRPPPGHLPDLPGERIWVGGGQWFYVAGILNPAALTPESTRRCWSAFRPPRSTSASTATRPRLRARHDRPGHGRPTGAGGDRQPREPQRGQRRPALRRARRPSRPGALDGLFLGLGAVALLVGAIGVANVMVISVLERRSEIGLRRALGATRGTSAASS